MNIPDPRELIRELRSAPVAGSAEPVAWRYRLIAEKPERWAIVDKWPPQFDGYDDRDRWMTEPLYTHPAAIREVSKDDALTTYTQYALADGTNIERMRSALESFRARLNAERGELPFANVRSPTPATTEFTSLDCIATTGCKASLPTVASDERKEGE